MREDRGREGEGGGKRPSKATKGEHRAAACSGTNGPCAHHKGGRGRARLATGAVQASPRPVTMGTGREQRRERRCTARGRRGQTAGRGGRGRRRRRGRPDAGPRLAATGEETAATTSAGASPRAQIDADGAWVGYAGCWGWVGAPALGFQHQLLLKLFSEALYEMDALVVPQCELIGPRIYIVRLLVATHSSGLARVARSS